MNIRLADTMDIEKKGIAPEDLRYAMLATHYRTKYNFTLIVDYENLVSSVYLANVLDSNNAEVRQLFDQGKDINSTIKDIENLLSVELNSWGVERRDVNTISTIVEREMSKAYK